jgi:hypothetical protein
MENGTENKTVIENKVERYRSTNASRYAPVIVATNMSIEESEAMIDCYADKFSIADFLGPT